MGAKEVGNQPTHHADVLRNRKRAAGDAELGLVPSGGISDLCFKMSFTEQKDPMETAPEPMKTCPREETCSLSVPRS